MHTHMGDFPKFGHILWHAISMILSLFDIPTAICMFDTKGFNQ